MPALPALYTEFPSPLIYAHRVCDHVSNLTGDFAHHAILVDVDEIDDRLASHAERHQQSPTSRPYFLVPLGLLAWLALGKDPAEWLA